MEFMGNSYFRNRDDNTKIIKVFNIIVTKEDVDMIMNSALVGGITYWCSEALAVGDMLGDELSVQLGLGGSIYIRDSNTGDIEMLTMQKLVDGLQRYICSPKYEDTLCIKGGNLVLNFYKFDAVAADQIVQYGLFHEIRYFRRSV